MDEDTLNAAMRILNMAKVLESHGKLNRLMDMLGDCTEITWDNQCMVERFACESVFQNTKCYEQCGKQVSHHAYEPDREVYVLRDPLLDRFHALCREYESRRGITRIENPYARELEDAVHSAMRLSNYNFAHAFRMAPDRFSNERVGDVPARPPQSMAFLRLGLYMINRVVY